MTATAPTMRRLTAQVDTHLRFDVSALPAPIWEQVKLALTFENPEKQRAMRERVGNWRQMPSTIKMWEPGVLPRGFAVQFRRGMEQSGIELDWDDQRKSVPIYTEKWKHVVLRDYQQPACERILKVQQGIWEAPPGAGKTVTVLEAIRRARQRAVVIVNTTNIARQWVQRSEQFLGYTPGVVGDGEFDVRDITIALQQSLWARRDEFDENGFWELFGFVCMDECHHLPALSFLDTVQRFPAQYRIGVSATPEMQSGTLPFAEAAVGLVFHTTDKKTLVESGTLVKPSVEVLTSEFRFPYFPTHDHRPGTQCGFQGCTASSHLRTHRNNYTKMVEALCTDDERNEMIADRVASEIDGHAWLVLSSRLAHLAELRRLIESKGGAGRCYDMTGRQESEERMRVAARAEQGSCVIFSTIADEAVDIPRLDRVVLAWPVRNVNKVKQRIGRIERVHREKSGAIVIDVLDKKVGVLRSQFYERHNMLYRSQGLQITGLPNRPNNGV